MFKKVYKEINDSIPVNNELLQSLLSEAEKPVKRVKFKNIYRYGGVAAAALLLTVSAIGVSEIGFPAAKSKPVKSDIATASDTAAEQKVQGNAKAIQEESISDSSVYYDTVQAENTNKARSIPEKEAADSYSADMDIDLTVISLPEGVVRLGEAAIASAEADSSADSDRVITYSDGHKSLKLTITYNLEFINDMLAKHPSNRVYGDDGYIGAYVLKDGFGYRVDCYNFTEDEVTALLLSL